MIDFSGIKLIIWDLDETLWSGTVSDNEAICIKNEFIDFINESLDRGIVHSICSKNDFETTKQQLISFGVWELFVFPSINWNPKGERIKRIIDDMKLRADNVLFVDDNTSNLQEALYYCEKLHTCLPQDLILSINNIHNINKVDANRPRLLQYKVLEEKNKTKESFSSNEEFLMSCNIRVEFHKDCVENIDRIHDLIMRSNQLNYTKFRQSKEELLKDLSNVNTDSAYITVKDSFGDYGIVGFYMQKEGKVIHYLFSCRTLGMLVEQYVYLKIGCPSIDVVGDVVTELDAVTLPKWINRDDSDNDNKENKKNTGDLKILFKGPCDISQIFSFIEENPNIKTDFTYVNDKGITVEGHNHTSQIVTALKADDKEKAQLINETKWFDEKMFDKSLLENNDAIVFSLLNDGNLGIYQHKETGWQVALCERYYDLTNEKNWDNYINGKIFTSSIKFTREDLREFSEKYSYVDNDTADVTLCNLDEIYSIINKKTKMILILGSEVPFKKQNVPSYANRHIFHKTINDKIKLWAKDKKNVFLIEISRYITSQNDYTNTINHFQKKVYYHLTQEILGVLNADNTSIKRKSKLYLYFAILEKKVKNIAKKVLNRA